MNVLFDIDFSYPGIEIKVEFLVMQEYFNHMESGINAICKNYIEKEEQKITNLDFEDYKHIYSVAEDLMPRIIRLPFVVTIYTLFENSISLLLNYSQEKESKALGFKDINGRTTIEKYNKYMEHVLFFDFKFNDKDIEMINNIVKVRNCIAHANGNLESMSREKVAEIIKLSKIDTGVIIENNQLDVSYEFLSTTLKTVSDVIRSLMGYIESKYDLNAFRNSG